MLASRSCDNSCASDGVAEVKEPVVTLMINLGCLGKHLAEVAYHPDHGDIAWIAVCNDPLYLELEPTTLDDATLAEIDGMIAEDRHERAAEAAEHLADVQREDALLNRDIIGGMQ